MPKPPVHPLVFKCLNCGKESTYTKYLKESDDPDQEITVIKRCTHCGKENKVHIPPGYTTTATTSVLRGV